MDRTGVVYNNANENKRGEGMKGFSGRKAK